MTKAIAISASCSALAFFASIHYLQTDQKYLVAVAVILVGVAAAALNTAICNAPSKIPEPPKHRRVKVQTSLPWDGAKRLLTGVTYEYIPALGGGYHLKLVGKCNGELHTLVFNSEYLFGDPLVRVLQTHRPKDVVVYANPDYTIVVFCAPRSSDVSKETH